MGERAFAVDQVLTWQPQEEGRQLQFSLDTPASDIGIHFAGQATVSDPAVMQLAVNLTNAQASEIAHAHHSIHLDLSTIPGLDDAAGDRTFLYTSVGWLSLKKLFGEGGRPPTSIWVGATHRDATVIWRLIARVSESGKLIIAFGMDRGYAFASNHPEWPKGLLTGCRWGTLPAHEKRKGLARLYVCQNGLDELRQRYAHDFRHA